MRHTITNKGANTLGNALKTELKPGSNVSIVAAYLTIYGHSLLNSELQALEEVRILLNHPLFRKNEVGSIPVTILGDKSETQFKHQLDLQRIATDCANWVRKKVKIRAMTESYRLGTKMIISDDPKGENVCINTTPLDFNGEGLGFVPSDRILMTTLSKDPAIISDMADLFESVWNDASLVEDVKTEFLSQLEYGTRDQSPQFIYFFTLYNIFRAYLDDLDEEKIVKTRTGFKDSVIWNKLYKFQQDGALGAIDKIEKHGGCIIADSVGLGKTFEALAVIKYYELRNDRVLVLCPKKLRDNWTMYRLNDTRNILLKDRFNYDVLNHTDLSRERGKSGEINLESINWSNYDLVVIDESHNFRNNNPSKKHIPRYARLLNYIIRAGVKTKVLMLSATPVNNRMNDLKNQVAFITEANDSAFERFGIDSIGEVMRRAQAQFNNWLRDKENTDVAGLLEILDGRYFKLLDLVTIARSRKHIEKYYNTAEIGEFPDRLPPINIKADIDLANTFPPLKEINREIQRLNLSPYSPLKYVQTDKQQQYGKKYDLQVEGRGRFRQLDREESLIHLMRVNLLKRMESSINSFVLTVKRLVESIDALLEKILNESEFTNEDLNIEEVDIDDPMLEDFLIGNKVKVLMQDMDLIRWKQDLLEDKATLEKTLFVAQEVTADRDAKLSHLKKVIQQKANNPINKENRKIIVFTAFADTAHYLYKEIATWANEELGIHSALITGSGKNATNLPNTRRDLTDLLTNFSPISKERNPELINAPEIDLLIATDCISEGQNLQDCDYLVNYDIHWNPVRIIQRFGRVDRLGSINKQIQLVNFWPNMELDEYIDLEARVSGRMVLLDISATGEENIIDQKVEMNDLDYRKRQLEQLQSQVIDLEDMQGGISITDLTFNDFKMELMDFMKTNRGELDRTPTGIYSVVDSGDAEIPPGVIFCLRQKNAPADEKLEYNPLAPCFLTYVRQDGETVFSFVQSKRVLDQYQLLCAGKTSVSPALVDAFKSETNQLKDMSRYRDLLDGMVAHITGKSSEKGTASLFHAGGTATRSEVTRKLDDFELVSYLVIKGK